MKKSIFDNMRRDDKRKELIKGKANQLRININSNSDLCIHGVLKNIKNNCKICYPKKD